MNDLLFTNSELELRIINRKKLKKLGIDEKLIEQFLNYDKSSITYKTYIVGALETLKGVTNKQAYIAYSIAPDTEELALYRATSILMYAWYHKHVENLDYFETFDSLTVAVDSSKKLAVLAPIDYLSWTEPLAETISALEEKISASKLITSKGLWLSGTLSARCRTELQKRGWEISSEVSFD